MIQIAIMGLGTVGTGVARVVEENAQQIQRKLGEPLQVKTVLVRHFHDGPYRHLMTDDFRKIEEDPDIRVVAWMQRIRIPGGRLRPASMW